MKNPLTEKFTEEASYNIKNIEKKLAKRAYKSQKVIEELKSEAELLEKEKNSILKHLTWIHSY